MAPKITLGNQYGPLIDRVELLSIKMEEREASKKQYLYKIMELNTEGIIIYVSRSMIQLTGFDKEEMEGEHYSKFIQLGASNINWELILTGTIVGDEYVFYFKDKEVKMKGFFEPICKVKNVPYKVELKVVLL